MPKACGDPESMFGLLLRGVYAELCRSTHRNDEFKSDVFSWQQGVATPC